MRTYRHRSFIPFLAQLVGGLAVLLIAAGAHGQEPTEEEEEAPPFDTAFAIDDEDPEQAVPSAEQANANPLEMGYYLMQLAERAELAAKSNHHAKAAKYFRAMARAVPDRATAFGKACGAHAAAGQWPEALEMCRVALGTEGMTIDDLTRFAQVVAAKDSAITPEELEEVDEVLKRLDQEAGGNHALVERTLDLRCQIATRLEDVPRLEECTAALATIAPNSPKTFVYASTLAYAKNDGAEAKQILERAKKAGLPPDAIAALEKTFEERGMTRGFDAWGLGIVLVVGFALAALLFFALRASRRRPANVV